MIEEIFGLDEVLAKIAMPIYTRATPAPNPIQILCGKFITCLHYFS